MNDGRRYPNWTPGIELREDWLASVREDIIDPEREIVDPHHHLWRHGDAVYELDALHSDTGAGHNVVQTVYVECRSYYRSDGDPAFHPVGETAHIARLAASIPAGKARIAGIIAHADLRRPDLSDLLDAHVKAGQGRLVGIRHSGARDPEPHRLMIPGRGDDGLYADPDFRRGVALLGERGLTYDTWHYHHQADAFLALAKAVPGTTLVLDHLGTPLGVGRFAGRRNTVHAVWKEDMTALARCPNVMAKLGGLSMPDNGWAWHERHRPPSSDELVAAQGAWFRHMIACFGPERCMFESNFPVDRVSVSYAVLWNAFKKIAMDHDADAQAHMFAGTARSVYGLSPLRISG
ncbi:amidohydrolase family protein [Sedimentitalea todarodis]|uniref:Amidohydrolase family protein n=1 Tax=Sedimentitalea todarodis TaxID=1631240 RepID=A0ABU3VAS4_9RHOB|nr:amidohydrolase family protein [Sedimentitalea todarodis]MDU9003259.1 amidohydrolase family protein [Sedimentitalea todarodis]